VQLGCRERSQSHHTPQAPWWNVFFDIDVTHTFVHEEHQTLVPDPTVWPTDSGRELPVTRSTRDTSLPATSVEEQPLRFESYGPLKDLLPRLADCPTHLTDLDAYFAALR
jgi:hypothetical protein